MNVVQKAKSVLGLGGSEEDPPEPPASDDADADTENDEA
jgi:hypothetical protein